MSDLGLLVFRKMDFSRDVVCVNIVVLTSDCANAVADAIYSRPVDSAELSTYLVPVRAEINTKSPAVFMSWRLCRARSEARPPLYELESVGPHLYSGTIKRMTCARDADLDVSIRWASAAS